MTAQRFKIPSGRSPRRIFMNGLAGLAAGIVCATQATGQGVNQITTVSPASAAQGTSGLTVTFALDTDAPPAPPAGVVPTSVTLGTMTGGSVTHASQYTVTAQFTIPSGEAVGWKDAGIVFALPTPPGGTLTFSKSSAFQVTAGSGVAAGFTATPTSGKAPLAVSFTDASTGTIGNRLWSFGDGVMSTATHPAHTYTSTGAFTVSLTVSGSGVTNTLTRAGYITVTSTPSPGGYTIVDTGQTKCYNATTEITAPASGQPFYGQDAQCAGHAPSYTLSGDGLTVYDNVSGLTWVRSPDTSGDGNITGGDKLTYANALLRPAALNAVSYGGFSDWRLPTIKEQYSLIDFRGTDPSGLAGNDTTGLIPYINTNYFKFAYGNPNEGDRIIDSQYASSTLYISTADESLLFGVNFADGRIKGYGLTLGSSEKTFFVQCVRGNTSYGLNQFVDNGDQTVTDQATGLMWSMGDSGAGLNWSTALAWVQARNASDYLGHSDWRLPNAKELQSIVDYTRSPDTSASAAIDTVFTCTQITNEEYQVDYPWYWSGTTHAADSGSGAAGAYVCFGRAMGYMNSTWRDIHGAGCQRSDPKGSLSGYTQRDNGYYNSVAPQGDAVRCYNYVRLVRDYPANADSVGDGIPDWWRAQWFGGSGMATNSQSFAASDPDNDGMTNLEEYRADTGPTNESSRLAFVAISPEADGLRIWWIGGSSATQLVEVCGELMGAGTPWKALATNAPPTAVTNSLLHPGTPATSRFYRIKACR